MLDLPQHNYRQIVVVVGRNLLENAKLELHLYLHRFVHLMAR
jgi:hypothetical protein